MSFKRLYMEDPAVYALSYLENNSFCILILLIILKCHCQNLDHRPCSRFFCGVIIAMIAYTVMDMLCGLQENGFFAAPVWMVCLMNVLFFYASAAVAYLGFLYAESELDARWLRSPERWALYSLPLLVLLITVPLSLPGKFYFYIDASGHYIKGPLYPLLWVLCYGYLAVIGIRAVIELLSMRNYSLHPQCLALVSFVVLPLAAGVLQSLFTGVSIICLAAAVSAVQIFVNLQQARITIDPLTQINNRTKLVQYLDKCVSHQKSGSERKLTLCMIDINDFKQINDRYGHPEGDTALRLMAETLKDVGSRFKCHIFRYGGDEFFVVLETKSNEEAAAFRQDLIHTLEESNRLAGKPYNVEISLGFADYDPRLTVPEMIEKADQALYRNKSLKKGITAGVRQSHE